MSGTYILGPSVKRFEKLFSSYIGTSNCIAVASGTDAVHFALRACGIKPGDGVITASHTAIATVSAIDWIGARPVLVDIEPKSFTLDPKKVEETLLSFSDCKIKAIVAVHLYGHPADMAVLKEVADLHHVPLIEDCAQAHGAMIGEQKVGSLGKCGAFSFYPTKNLGAFGDAGAIVSRDEEITKQLGSLQQYGWRERYISDQAGYNSRLDELQAAFLCYKLSYLDADNERRRQIARLYSEGLSGLPIKTPTETYGYYHVYHQYTIRCSCRDALREFLMDHGISASILYPTPVHLQRGYSQRVTVGVGGMGITERAAVEILCLPIYPSLQDSDVTRVIDTIHKFFKKNKT